MVHKEGLSRRDFLRLLGVTGGTVALEPATSLTNLLYRIDTFHELTQDVASATSPQSIQGQSKSLRKALAQIGIQPPVSVPSGCSFQLYPRSLKELLAACEPLPNFGSWHVDVHNFNEGWCNNFQGLAELGDGIWFFSNQYHLFKVLWNGDSVKVLNSTGCVDIAQDLYFYGVACEDEGTIGRYHHFGDICYYRGILLVPFEFNGDAHSPLILAFTEDLEFLGWATLDGKRESRNNGWCDIHPWNDLLYVSDDISNDIPDGYKGRLYAYNIDNLLWLKDEYTRGNWIGARPVDVERVAEKDIHLDLIIEDGGGTRFGLSQSGNQVLPFISFPPVVLPYRVQIAGVTFSRTGHIYISTAIPKGTVFGDVSNWYSYVLVFDSLTTTRHVVVDLGDPDTGYELQGLSINERTNELVVAFLENEWHPDDYLDLRVYGPSPSERL